MEETELGKNYDGITNDLFGLKTNRHIIFYRKRINQPIEINIPSNNEPKVNNPNGGVSKPLGKPNKSWTASDYQKYYDNMKKQKK